MKMTEYRLV